MILLKDLFRFNVYQILRIRLIWIEIFFACEDPLTPPPTIIVEQQHSHTQQTRTQQMCYAEWCMEQNTRPNYYVGSIVSVHLSAEPGDENAVISGWRRRQFFSRAGTQVPCSARQDTRLRSGKAHGGGGAGALDGIYLDRLGILRPKIGMVPFF